ncbi:hypothetical protein AXF42_Ash012032 [Apostasia shenzhenica]|uniref:Uncharacterized protein n=1 Tax=Apostasia shenzhenica TaxID=1088818 RepID=A0A2I0AJM1_9ASPA|nr:hypothetical protein AXF42_Ash012032 [Apostasia shenzhenica]
MLELAKYCMAEVSSKGRVIAGSFFFKRLAAQDWATKSRDLAPLSVSRRGAHYASHYEKEVEEQVCPEVVPNHMIDDSSRSNKYWGPHPITGIFGPADLNVTDGSASAALRHWPAAGNGGSSALDETVRFRPLDLEDLEKTHHA